MVVSPGQRSGGRAAGLQQQQEERQRVGLRPLVAFIIIFILYRLLRGAHCPPTQTDRQTGRVQPADVLLVNVEVLVPPRYTLLHQFNQFPVALPFTSLTSFLSLDIYQFNSSVWN